MYSLHAQALRATGPHAGGRRSIARDGPSDFFANCGQAAICSPEGLLLWDIFGGPGPQRGPTSKVPAISSEKEQVSAAVTAQPEQTWSLIQAELCAAVDGAIYRIWLEPLEPLAFDGSVLTIQAPAQACGWIRDRFGRLLQACAAAVLDPTVTVDLVARTPAPEDPAPARSKAATNAVGRDPATGLPTQQLLGNPKLTFDQFVIGDSNRLAHAAALTVAEMPGQAYNPLFICGPPGVGKTHLLRAIAALLLSHNPSLIVRFTTGEAFTNEFLFALGGGKVGGFKDRFRRVDVLLVDDVHFLERKTKTEEEFFHTFNDLYEVGCQIVLTPIGRLPIYRRSKIA